MGQAAFREYLLARATPNENSGLALFLKLSLLSILGNGELLSRLHEAFEILDCFDT